MRKLHAQTVSFVIERMREGKTLRAACEEAGVSPGDALDRAGQSRRLTEQIGEALDLRVALVEDALYENALKGNVTAQTLFLCNRAPERWRPANATAKPENAPDPERVTPAQLLARYAREDAEEGRELEAAAG